MMIKIGAYLAPWFFVLHSCRAFLPTRHYNRQRGTGPDIIHPTAPSTINTWLASTQDDDVSDDDAAAPGRGGFSNWKLTNDFPLFLNQLSLQSFLTVLRSLRDPQTIRWVDNFTQPVIPSSVANDRLTEATQNLTSIATNPDGKSYSQLLTYHGLAAMNTTIFPTWESYFSTLLEQPAQALTVQSSGIQVKDYELDINPASLCARLISVREQIAAEMAHDLLVVANSMGNETMTSYWEYMHQQRKSDDDDEEEMVDTKKPVIEIGSSDEDTTTPADHPKGTQKKAESPGDANPRRLAPHNLVFLEYSLDPNGDLIPSTLRKGNFDLAVLLATQESIHRILNNEQQEDVGDKFHIYQKYLLDFYAQRLVSHFGGNQRYGRADDFLEELLFAEPRVSTAGGFAAVVDPVQVAQMILNERKQVAFEWSARSKDVPNDHIAIKRMQFDALMQSYYQEEKQESAEEEK